MAGQYKNSISLGIKLQPTSEVQIELKTAIEQLNKNSSIDLKIDTTQINQSLKDFSSTLMNVGDQLKSHFNMHGVSDEIDMLQKKITKVKGSSLDIGDGSKGFDELQQRAKVIRETVDELAKISFNTTKSGSVKDASITYTDNMGKLVTETMKWKNVSGDAENEVKRVFTTTNIAVSENIKTLENYKQKLEETKSKMQSSLNTLSSNSKNSNNLNGFIDESVIKSIQSRLNSINTNTADSEIKELQNTIKNLGSSESQIVRVQNAILKLENGLTNLRGKYSGLVGDSSSKAELSNYISQIENLKKVLSSLNNGDSLNGAKISQEIGKGTNASRELSTAVKNSSNALKLATTDSESFGQSIRRTLSNAGIYMGTYQAINMITSALKDGIKNIIDIDTQMRDLAKVSSATTEQLSKFSQVANKIAINVGTSTESVISATTYYSKLGYSIEEASKRAEKASIFANVADMGIDDASKALITIQKGFDLNSLEDMNRVMDVANAVGNNYSSTSQNVAEGLRRMGNAMKEAGNSYEQSVGLFVAGNASVQDAEVVGNAIKTITMRLRGMKTEIDETGIPATKLRQAIKDVTATTGQEIDIMKDDNTFKSTYQQMTELSQVYPKLTDAQRSYLQYVIAGQRQGNIFSGMMTNMKEGTDAYTTALNSNGSAMREQQIFMNSIEGKLNKLKETFKQFWVSTISSDSVKNMVDGLTSVVSIFGNLPSIVGLATTAFLIFKGQAIIGAISGLMQYATTLTSVISRVGLMKIAIGELSIAMSTNPFGLLAIGITTAVIALDLFGTSTEQAKQKNEELLKSIQQSKTDISSLEQLKTQYENLNKELDNGSLSTEQAKQKKQELSGVYQKLIQLAPELEGLLNSESEDYKNQSKAIQNIIDLKKQEMALKSEKYFDDNSISDKTIQQKIEQMKRYRQMMESNAKYATMSDEELKNNNALGWSSGDTVRDQNKHSELQNKQKLMDINQELQTIMTNYNTLNGMGLKSPISNEMINSIKEASSSMDVYGKEIKTTSSNANSNTKLVSEAMNQIRQGSSVSSETISKISQSYPNLGINASNAKQKIQELNKAISDTPSVDDQTNKEQENANAIANATKEYGKSTEAIAKMQGYLDKINKTHSLTPTLVTQISKAYPELASQVGNVTQLEESLKQKIQEQADSQLANYEIMMGSDQEFYSQKIKNNQSFEDSLNAFLNSFVTNSEDAYNIDTNNYKTLNELKQGIQGDFGESINQWLSQYVDTSVKGYSIDLSNFKSLADAKQGILKILKGEMDKLNQAMATMTKNIADQAKAIDNAKSSDVNSLNSEKLYGKDIQALESLADKQKQVQGGINDFNASFDKFGIAEKGLSGGSIGNGGTGTPAKDTSKADAKKAEKELEDSEKKMIDNITDAYNKAKDIISNDIEEIDAKITGLGDIDDSNFTQKVSLVNDKIGEQKKIVDEADKQLQALKNTTVTTADAQESLENATLKASKELRQESLEVAKLQSEIEKTDIDELKKMYEDQKSIETETLEANQKAQTDKIESIKQAQEDAHNQIMNDYEDELTALDNKSKKLDEDNDKIERANELEKEKNDLLEKQKELSNLESQKTVKTLKQDSSGAWSYVGEVDTTAIATKQKEVTEAQKTLDDTNRKNALDDAKKEIEDKKTVIEAEKTAEDDLYKKKKEYLDKYSDDLKESQDRDTKRLENNYSDIEKMAKDTLKKLEEEHNNDWNAISDSISLTLTRTKKALEDLTTLRANFTTSEANDAINSGDVSGYVTKNKDKMNLKANVDESDIDAHLSAISDNADEATTSITILNKTYDELLSKKSISNITEADINDKKVQVQKTVDIDNEGLTNTLNNLKTINATIEAEIDSHYAKLLDKQNISQQSEMDSLKVFAEEYTTYYNKFLELVQTVNDFRFNNIVVNVQSSVDNVLQGLEVIAKAYEKYAKAYNIMHPKDKISSSVDISDVQSANNTYKQSVTGYQANVLASYSTESFEKYASQIGSGIGDSIVSKLNSYSSSTGVSTSTSNSTTNNSNKSTTSSTSIVINGVTVNADNAEDFLSSLLTKAKQTSVLKSIN